MTSVRGCEPPREVVTLKICPHRLDHAPLYEQLFGLLAIMVEPGVTLLRYSY